MNGTRPSIIVSTEAFAQIPNKPLLTVDPAAPATNIAEHFTGFNNTLSLLFYLPIFLLFLFSMFIFFLF